MGKKTKKTRWRALSIDLGVNSNGHDKNHNHSAHHREDTSTLPPSPVHTETKVYFNEDEYTKITTPRQDVLFKKGYFARRRYQLAGNMMTDPNLTSGYEVPCGDYLEDDYVNEDYEGQGFYNSASYVDASTPMYYNYGNNSYEVYDPYTGSMTFLMGGPGQYPPPSNGQPMMPPPPMNVDWYNQQTPCYPSKPFSGDTSQTYTSPDSICPPTSPQDVYDDPTLYPQSFIYPGYMLSNNYHTTGSGGVPVFTSPPQTSSCDSSSFKKRKRRKKRKKEGATEEEYESSSEDQCSQSGASEQLDSKTTSDSGVHTHNSGESTPVTPPLSISFYPHPMPFTSTDEDSTSMPYYNPYHHINYNYRDITPVTSVIDPHYVMHKSKKLKGKRPKEDLNKFFPTASPNGGPCSFHSRDLTVPPPQPPPKQMTILKPEMPRKFPPPQFTILKNTALNSPNEKLTQQKDSPSPPTAQTIEKVSEHSCTINSATNDTNPTTCSNKRPGHFDLAEENDKRIITNDVHQTINNIPEAIEKNSRDLSNGNRIDNDVNYRKVVVGKHKEHTDVIVIKKTVNENTVIPDKKAGNTEKVIQVDVKTTKENIKSQEKSQLTKKINNEVNEKFNIKDEKEKLTNGHILQPVDKQSPSPPKNVMTNGFHTYENTKTIENGFGRVKQKQKTKKPKPNPINGLQNGDKSISKEQIEVEENVQNGQVTPTNEKLTFKIEKAPKLLSNGDEQILDEKCSKKTARHIADNNSISISEGKVNGSLHKSSNPCVKELQNVISDNTVEDNFETCSNKSEELEELYIKSNPLLAKLVDMESLNNNEQHTKDKNKIALTKQSLEKDKENIHNEEEDIESKVKNKTSSIPREIANKLVEAESITSERKFSEEKENANQKKTEPILDESLDVNVRLNENKEDKINESLKTNNNKKKSDKKKKSKEENKTQTLANTNAKSKVVKEKSPELIAPSKQTTTESSIDQRCIEQKSQMNVKTEEKLTQNKPNKKNIGKGESEKQTILKERIIPEKQVTRKEEKHVISNGRISPEKQSLTNKIQDKEVKKKRSSSEKDVVSRDKTTQKPVKERVTPEKQVASKDIPQEKKTTKERITPSPERLPKRKNSKKKSSPPPAIKSGKNDTTIDTAQSFIEDMLTEAVNKVKMKMKSTDKIVEDKKQDTSNVIKPDIVLNTKTPPERKLLIETNDNEQTNEALVKEPKENKQTNEALIKEPKDNKQTNEALVKEPKENKQTNEALVKEPKENKQTNEALVKEPKENKQTNEALVKEPKENKQTNEALVKEPKENKQTNEALLKEPKDNKQTNEALAGELKDNKQTKEALVKEPKEVKEVSKAVEEVKERKPRKLSRQNSNKSIKSQGKVKTRTPTRTPERTPSEVQPPVLHLTDVVTKWLQEEHGGKLPVDFDEDDEEEVFVQPDLTGSKNWISNPSPVSYVKTSGERVAISTSDLTERCNAKDSVSKYYNLGIRTSPESEVFCPQHGKNEKQFKHPGPLPPCGICCMIQ